MGRPRKRAIQIDNDRLQAIVSRFLRDGKVISRKNDWRDIAKEYFGFNTKVASKSVSFLYNYYRKNIAADNEGQLFGKSDIDDELKSRDDEVQEHEKESKDSVGIDKCCSDDVDKNEWEDEKDSLRFWLAPSPDEVHVIEDDDDDAAAMNNVQTQEKLSEESKVEEDTPKLKNDSTNQRATTSDNHIVHKDSLGDSVGNILLEDESEPLQREYADSQSPVSLDRESVADSLECFSFQPISPMRSLSPCSLNESVENVASKHVTYTFPATGVEESDIVSQIPPKRARINEVSQDFSQENRMVADSVDQIGSRIARIITNVARQSSVRTGSDADQILDSIITNMLTSAISIPSNSTIEKAQEISISTPRNDMNISEASLVKKVDSSRTTR